MAFSALVRRLLISCPGDIPQHDLEVVRKAIERWNGIYGPSYSAVVLPISWGTHAAAEFGASPQEILNRQLVDDCDICIALFANRLGTPTAIAESGTAEEIIRLGESGHYVAILRSRRSVDPSQIDLAQAQRLQEYLDKISGNSLVLPYSSDDELSRNVDNILASAVSRDQGRIDLQIQQAATQRVAEVWPRIESSDQIRTDSRGRTTTSRRWALVLSNTGDAPARDVRFQLEPEQDGDEGALWQVIHDNPTAEPKIEILAPRGEASFILIVAMQMVTQARCRVSWSDDRGRQENVATLRLG